jgi:hypothetical protein
MALELFAIGDDEDEGSILQLTMATDIWAFAMTAIEVSALFLSSSFFLQSYIKRLTDLLRRRTLFVHQRRYESPWILHVRSSSQAGAWPPDQQRHLDDA